MTEATPSTNSRFDRRELQAESVTGDGQTQTVILLFDRNGHPVVPTCAPPRRRAERRSRMAEGHRVAARSVLDGREHDGTLAADGRR
jgi:hypothetical protein